MIKTWWSLAHITCFCEDLIGEIDNYLNWKRKFSLWRAKKVSINTLLDQCINKKNERFIFIKK